MDRTTIFAQCGEVGGDLPVEQSNFLQLAAAQAGKAFSSALIQ
jgi:hypothetical protein